MVRLLRRRGWKVICWAIALGVIVGGASYYFQTPVYEAGAQVFIQQSNRAYPGTQTASPVDPASFAASQAILVRSPAVAQAQRLASVPRSSRRRVCCWVRCASWSARSSNVLTIIASSRNPAEAQATANAFANAYIAEQPRRSDRGLPALASTPSRPN